MRPEMAGRVVFLSLFALTLYLMYLIFRPFLPGIVWATVLAVAFQPLYSRLVRWLRGRRWTAAILLSATVAAFLVLPAGLALFKVGQGVLHAYTWLSARTASGQSALDTIRGLPVVSSAAEWVGTRVDLSDLNVRSMALSHLQTLGGLLTTQTRNVLSNTIRSLITLAVLLVTMAVLFHEGPRLLDTVRRSLPLGDKDKEEVFAQMQAVTRAVFFGVLMTALVQALLATLGFAIVGLAGAVTLGAATFFCALLPGGTALVWGPVVLWLFFSGHPVKALIVLAWGVAVVGTVDNFLRPIFISRGVRMHLLLVFFGILGGIMAFGLIGLFTGPLVITLFLFFLEVVRRDFFTGEAAQTVSS